MRVFYDSGSLIVEGTKQSYPAQSLTYESDSGRISIFLRDGKTKVLAASWEKIQDYDGNGLPNLAALLVYLDDELSKTPNDHLIFSELPNLP